jgi:hypothetical protein
MQKSRKKWIHNRQQIQQSNIMLKVQQRQKSEKQDNNKNETQHATKATIKCYIISATKTTTRHQ